MVSSDRRQVPCNIATTAPPFHRSCGQRYAYALVSRQTGVRQRTVSSHLPLVTRKVNCSRKKRSSLRPSAGHLRSTDRVSGFTTSSAFVRTFTFARTVACALMGDLHHVIVRYKNSSRRCCAAGWVALGGTQSCRSHDSCLCQFFRRSSRQKCSARMAKK